jgi:CRP-like cAMP-binding protein
MFRNALLNVLRPKDLEAIQGALSLVCVPAGVVLEKPYEPIKDVFFPETGVFSIDGMTRSGFSMQIAMIGREGVSGTALMLGNAGWAHTTVVHAEALAWKVPADEFKKLLARNLRLRNVLLRYTGIIAGQIASAALANGRSTIPERLARWILQMHSRIDGESFEATQEVIAGILGVRRQGITSALQVFERENLILPTRGRIEVLDYQGLVAASGGSYRDGD